MINVPLFINNNLENGNGKRNERINAFAKTLNDAFKQYQKLWDDYQELFEKFQESQKNSSNGLNKVQNSVNQTNACNAAAKENTILEKESLAITEQRKLDCDVVTEIINRCEESSKPANNQIFQIFSQDFCTQGLEESFVINQSKNPLQEIQNITPQRPLSPILGLRRGKTRITPSSVSSPNLSQTSIVILDDIDYDRSPIIESRFRSNPLLVSNSNTALTKSVSNPILLSSPVAEAGVTPPSKNIKKLGISTICNVNTEIIVGSNKKLKQSRLFMTTEKVTDLSISDDVDKSEACNSATVTGDVINRKFKQKNNNCLEDSVIQGSPEHEKSGSKIRQKLDGRNKSTDILQQKLNIDGNTVTDVNSVEICESMNNNSQPDTDETIFDPKIASTQYKNLPFSSESLKIQKSLVKDKTSLKKQTELGNEGVNDSNVIDETMFEENVTSSSSNSGKSFKFAKSLKKKKLSLTKKFKSHKNLEETTTSSREIYGSKKDTTSDVSRPEKLNGDSPPRKKLALDHFDVPMKKKNKSPTYAYKGSPVRKQAERAQLNGWTCLECKKYYDAMGLDQEELQKRTNKCSRHRSKFNEKKVSQPAYWDPDFSSSYHSTMWTDD